LRQSEPLSCRLQQRPGDLLFDTSHDHSVSSMTPSSKIDGETLLIQEGRCRPRKANPVETTGRASNGVKLPTCRSSAERGCVCSRQRNWVIGAGWAG
jgi:hypothetical protein